MDFIFGNFQAFRRSFCNLKVFIQFEAVKSLQTGFKIAAKNFDITASKLPKQKFVSGCFNRFNGNIQSFQKSEQIFQVCEVLEKLSHACWLFLVN